MYGWSHFNLVTYIVAVSASRSLALMRHLKGANSRLVQNSGQEIRRAGVCYGVDDPAVPIEIAAKRERYREIPYSIRVERISPHFSCHILPNYQVASAVYRITSLTHTARRDSFCTREHSWGCVTLIGPACSRQSLLYTVNNARAKRASL